ncbi:MAG: hypothetical protein WKF87_09270 [Chryseolinea sp.]
MRVTLNFFVIAVVVLAVSCKSQVVQRAASVTDEGFTKYVNPLIGTAPLTDPQLIGYTPPKGWRPWAGLVFPGVSMPNAMVQLSPVTEFRTGQGTNMRIQSFMPLLILTKVIGTL